MFKRFSVQLGLLLSVFLLSAQFAHAQEKQQLEIGVSFSIPPWVIQGTDSGIELDLLRLAFENTPYSPKPVYLPFAIVHSKFDNGQLDGFINAKPNPYKSGYLSDTVVTFENVAISLASNQYPEDLTVQFLGDKQVVAFQKARQLLGGDFSEMAQNNDDYQEIAKQALQLNLLFVRNIDFIVMDKSIFGYFWKAASENKSYKQAGYRYDKAVTFHHLFEPSHYAYRFKEEAVRDAFNAGLAKIRENGQYDEVLKRYDHLSDLYQQAKN